MSPDPMKLHPELAAKAGRLPRGVGRRWLLPVLQPVGRVVGRRSPRPGQREEHAGGEVFVHRPAVPRTDGAALLWIHGGGLIYGDAREAAPYVGPFVDELGLIAASVQYRLAPRHPFPAALDDCVAAFDWLATQPDVDPTRIVVGGPSAGGGLAAALTQRLTARGGPAPTFQLLIYPMLDDRTADAPAGKIDRQVRMWDRRSNQVGWSAYLRGHDRRNPPAFAVPARTADLHGLPPAWIGVGTLDLFHDEDVAYTERLRAAGVPVELVEVAGAYHGFDLIDAQAPVSAAFTRSFREAVARHLDA